MNTLWIETIKTKITANSGRALLQYFLFQNVDYQGIQGSGALLLTWRVRVLKAHEYLRSSELGYDLPSWALLGVSVNVADAIATFFSLTHLETISESRRGSKRYVNGLDSGTVPRFLSNVDLLDMAPLLPSAWKCFRTHSDRNFDVRAATRTFLELPAVDACRCFYTLPHLKRSLRMCANYREYGKRHTLERSIVHAGTLGVSLGNIRIRSEAFDVGIE
jgi:hypothetical protein